ncbi:MAG: 2-amino-4-hydroxy-6-hydroxymethyldihydropteridine diphosphokinase [Rhodospirillales bacterium]|nr:2-amino-4-hydroxy-6-hydroxymethyldihydropteridine diphosphokinase [Rhodospirillales bacterium]
MGIYIGVGANLPSPTQGPPLATCRAAVAALEAAGLVIVTRSRWYRSLPVPVSDQPPFINGVIEVSTEAPPQGLLSLLHHVEADFGRVRAERNAARVLDLDLLAYDNRVSEPGQAVQLPHPRLHERAFVLKPLAEIAPHWRHPRFGLAIADLVASLPPGQHAEPLAE